MATVLENLQTALANASAELAALNATKAGGLPNAGKSGVDHMGYLDRLMARIDKLQAQIKAQQAQVIQDEGPFEIISELMT